MNLFNLLKIICLCPSVWTYPSLWVILGGRNNFLFRTGLLLGFVQAALVDFCIQFFYENLQHHLASTPFSRKALLSKD